MLMSYCKLVRTASDHSGVLKRRVLGFVNETGYHGHYRPEQWVGSKDVLYACTALAWNPELERESSKIRWVLFNVVQRTKPRWDEEGTHAKLGEGPSCESQPQCTFGAVLFEFSMCIWFFFYISWIRCVVGRAHWWTPFLAQVDPHEISLLNGKLRGEDWRRVWLPAAFAKVEVTVWAGRRRLQKEVLDCWRSNHERHQQPRWQRGCAHFRPERFGWWVGGSPRVRLSMTLSQLTTIGTFSIFHCIFLFLRASAFVLFARCCFCPCLVTHHHPQLTRVAVFSCAFACRLSKSKRYTTPPLSPVNHIASRELSRPPVLTFDDEDQISPRQVPVTQLCSPPPNFLAPSPRKPTPTASPRRALDFHRNESRLRLQEAPRTPRSLLQRARGGPIGVAGKFARREGETQRPSTAPELTVPGKWFD